MSTGATVPGVTHRQAPQRPRILHEASVEVSLQRVLDELGCRRVLLVTSKSLYRAGGAARQLEELLQARCVGAVAGVRPHSPREDVLVIAERFRADRADTFVALGGGSVCDAVKAARLCLGNAVASEGDFGRMRSGELPVDAPRGTFVMIPTTLAAGEYTAYAGVTDTRGLRKDAYFHPQLAPDVVLLDPAMTTSTPGSLWLSTGIRALDHAVETWCSRHATPYFDALALHAIRLLVPGLRHCHAGPNDLQARAQCQVASWLSIQGFVAGISFGCSHGIGHALGGVAGVPHGAASCIVLPHALEFNATVNGRRQATLSQIMGAPGVAAADLVAQLVDDLGLPRRLRDLGVAADVLPAVATEAMMSRHVRANPRPIESVAEVMAILERAW